MDDSRKAAEVAYALGAFTWTEVGKVRDGRTVDVWCLGNPEEPMAQVFVTPPKDREKPSPHICLELPNSPHFFYHSIAEAQHTAEAFYVGADLIKERVRGRNED